MLPATFSQVTVNILSLDIMCLCHLEYIPANLIAGCDNVCVADALSSMLCMCKHHCKRCCIQSQILAVANACKHL